jgi:hypothetical protein
MVLINLDGVWKRKEKLPNTVNQIVRNCSFDWIVIVVVFFYFLFQLYTGLQNFSFPVVFWAQLSSFAKGETLKPMIKYELQWCLHGLGKKNDIYLLSFTILIVYFTYLPKLGSKWINDYSGSWYRQSENLVWNRQWFPSHKYPCRPVLKIMRIIRVDTNLESTKYILYSSTWLSAYINTTKSG